MLRTTSRFVSVLFVLSLVAFCAAAAQADSAAWVGGTDANWADTTGNWDNTPGAVPGTGNTATFNGAAGVGGAVINLGAGVTINTILFDTSAAAYTIGSGAVGSQTLTLDDSGAVTMNATVASNELFNANILLGTAAAGTYTFTNNSTTNSLTFAGGVQGGAGGAGDAKTLTVTGAGNTAIGGILANGGASSLALTKDGAGTLTLSGANTYAGGTTISNGTLQFAKLVSMPASGAVAVNAGTTLAVNVGGPGEWTTGTSGNGTIGGLLAGLGGQSGGTVSYSGNVTLGLEISGTQTYSGAIGNVGSSLSLSKSGSGTLVLSGGSDYSYTGATTVNAGTLVLNSLSTNGFASAAITINNGGTARLGASNKVVDSAVVTVNAGGTLDMNGFGETIAKLLGSGNVTSTAAASTLILKSGGSYTFSGVISGDGLSLQYYSGSQTLTLTGQSTYGGATRVGLGGVYNDTLILGVDNALPIGTALTADGSGACALDLNGHNQTISSLFVGSNNGGSQGNVKDSVGGGVLTITGGGVTLNGHNNGAGAVSAGILDLNGVTQTFSITGSNNASSSLYISSVIRNGGLTYNNGTSVNGFLSLSGANIYTGPTLVNGGTLRLDNTLALQNSPLDTSGAGAVNLNAGAGTYTFGGLSGSKNLSSVITTNLASMTTLKLNPQSGAAATYSGVIANGAMTVTKTGAGTQTLSGANTYTGGTIVSNGILIGASTTALSSGGVTVAGGATFAYRPAAAGALNLGTGVLTLNGGSTIGAALGGTAGQSAITSSASAVASSGTVTVDICGIPGVAVTAGVNNLITAAGGLDGGASFVLGKVFNNADFTFSALSTSATAISTTVTIATPLTAAYWTGGLTGATNVWAISDGSAASNWTTDQAGTTATGLVPGAGADVVISADSITTAPTATVLGTNMTIKTLTISDATNGLGVSADGFTLTIAPTDSGTGITMAATVPASVIAANVALGAAQTWTNNSANPLTVSGVVSGAYALTKSGAGTVILSGANTYSGTTTVSAGILTLSGNRTANAGAVSVGTAGSAGTLNIQGNLPMAGNSIAVGLDGGTGIVNQTAGQVSFTGGDALLIGNGSAGTNGTYNLSGGSITSYASTTRGVILGVNGGASGTPQVCNFNLSGSGNLSISGSALAVGRYDSAASFTDDTYNQTGGTAAVGQFTIGGAAGGSTDVNATVSITGGTFSATSFPGMGAGNNNAASLALGGTAVVTLPAFPTVRGAGSTATVVFDGATLVPYAASAAYMGGLTNAFIKAGGATFNVASGKDITVTQDLLTDAVSTGGGLTKLGAGTLTISGANTYTGMTSVNAGALVLGKQTTLNGSLANITPANVTVESGAVLGLGVGDALAGYFDSAAIGTVLTQMGTSTVSTGMKPGAQIGLDTTNATGGTFTRGTPIGDLSGGNSIGLAKLGSGTLVLAAANTYTGLTTVVAGVLKLGAAGDGINTPLGTTAAGTSVTSGAALDLGGVTLSTGEALTLNGTGVSSGGALTNSGAAATYSGPITLGSASSIVTNGDIVLSNIGTITGATFALTLGGTGSGTIAGGIGTTSGTLTKSGSGTWTLTGNNTYTGLTTVSAGTLTLSGNNTGTGGTTVNGGTLNVNNNHALGNSGTITLTSGTIDNTSGAAKVNSVASAITLGGNFAFSTAAGTSANSLSLGTGAVTNSGSRTITLNGSGVLTFGGIMTNTLAGNNTLTVNNGSGTTSASAVNFGGFVLSGTASTARTDTITGTGNVNITGPVRDVSSGTASSSLIKSGTGTLKLTGTNTYTGTTTVNGGTLLINSPGSLNVASAVTVNTGGTLGGDGTINGAVTVNTGGTLSPGAGTLTVNTSVAMATDSTYTWQFDGTTADKVVITGGLTLISGWNLALVAVGGVPAFGSTYDLFTYTGGFSGSFAGDIISTPAGWPTAAIAQDTTPGAGRVYLKFGKLGDTNADGVTDAADFITLKKNFGKSTGAGVAAGDFNDSGSVNWADLNILTSNMGAGGGGAPATAPEPATLGLLAIGALALLRRKRKA